MKLLHYILPALLAGALLVGCDQSEDPTNFAPTEITAAEATEVTRSSAVLHGAVSLQSGCSVDAFGIQYSTDREFVTNQQSVEGTGSCESFSVTIDELVPGTTYYYRTFAKGADITLYSEVKEFATLDLVEYIKGKWYSETEEQWEIDEFRDGGIVYTTYSSFITPEAKNLKGMYSIEGKLVTLSLQSEFGISVFDFTITDIYNYQFRCIDDHDVKSAYYRIVEEIELGVEDTETISLAVVSDEIVGYKSLDESIATVDEQGQITACAPGAVTILVETVHGGSAAVRVTVKQPEIIFSDFTDALGCSFDYVIDIYGSDFSYTPPTDESPAADLWYESLDENTQFVTFTANPNGGMVYVISYILTENVTDEQLRAHFNSLYTEHPQSSADYWRYTNATADTEATISVGFDPVNRIVTIGDLQAKRNVTDLFPDFTALLKKTGNELIELWGQPDAKDEENTTYLYAMNYMNVDNIFCFLKDDKIWAYSYKLMDEFTSEATLAYLNEKYYYVGEEEGTKVYLNTWNRGHATVQILYNEAEHTVYFFEIEPSLTSVAVSTRSASLSQKSANLMQ